ncbi:MAG: hypothetical protein ABI867_41215 [Kofleriaceae bacterium]
MRSLALALALLVACAPGGDQFGRGEPGLKEFTARMCACSEKVCVNNVIEDMAKWTKRIPATAPKMDPKVATDLMDRYNACMKTALATP